MVFGFASQNSTMPIDGIPTEITTQSGTWTYHRTMTRTWIFQSDDLPGGLLSMQTTTTTHYYPLIFHYTTFTCGDDTDRCNSSFLTRNVGKCSKELPPLWTPDDVELLLPPA